MTYKQYVAAKHSTDLSVLSLPKHTVGLGSLCDWAEAAALQSQERVEHITAQGS